MAQLNSEGDTIVVVLTALEKVATFRRGLRLPRSAVSSAASTQTPFRTIRGLRSPGIFVPSRIAVGIWRYRGGKDLVLLHRRHHEAVVLELTGQEFQRVVVTDEDPERTLRHLRLSPEHVD